MFSESKQLVKDLMQECLDGFFDAFAYGIELAFRVVGFALAVCGVILVIALSIVLAESIYKLLV